MSVPLPNFPNYLLTSIKIHVIRYCENMYERSGKKLFGSIKNATENLDKLKSRGFHATSLSTYDFSLLFTALLHNSIKKKPIKSIETTFHREKIVFLPSDDQYRFDRDIAVHLAVAGDVFNGVSLCCPFSHEMS